jgi:predicted nucleic acid-binding protein
LIPVRAVIADAGPLHYLVLVGHSELLPALFEKVIIPSAVSEELARIEAPDAVRNWIRSPPTWLEVRAEQGSPFDDESLQELDEGEKAALALAASLAIDLVLMDDREGVRVAPRKGFRVIGTLGILNLGARRDLINLAEAFEQIKRTNFRYREELMAELLESDDRG